MDSMSHSLNDSTISTVKHIESFLKMYDPQVSLEPRAYEVSSTMKDRFMMMCLSLQVPSQSGVDCGVHTMHNVRVAACVSYTPLTIRILYINIMILQHQPADFLQKSISPLELKIDVAELRGRLLSDCCRLNTLYSRR